VIVIRKCENEECGKGLDPIQGEKVEGKLLCWHCARRARWRLNNPGEPDPFWATGGPIPERYKLESLKDFAMRHMKNRPRWRDE